jgi:putative transposase
LSKNSKNQNKDIDYYTSKTVISNSHSLYSYLYEYCRLSRNLYNASLFRLRQNFTSLNKENLSDNEKEVVQEIYKVIDTYQLSKPKTLISYKFLEKLMRVNFNPDFFAGLPMQSSQLVLKDAIRDFKSWLASLSKYKKEPSLFLGKPKMPTYKKSEISMVKFTNQDCVLKNGKLKFPKTTLTLSLPNLDNTCILKEVQIKPYYNDFIVFVTYSKERVERNTGVYACGIDIGVNNLVALIDNKNSCLLYKGEIIKSCNQYFNKEKARLTSALSKCQNTDYRNTKRLLQLSKKRDAYIKDYMHKVSKDIVNHCINNDIGTIVIGKNKEWKQNINIGKSNNQNFVSIPFNTIIAMIQYKAERNGIKVIIREESYTSKASFIDDDFIPNYNETTTPVFSGKRIKRGLYKSGNGVVINADLNGAANILRKEFPDAFKLANKKDIFNNIIIKNIHNIN